MTSAVIVNKQFCLLDIIISRRTIVVAVGPQVSSTTRYRALHLQPKEQFGFYLAGFFEYQILDAAQCSSITTQQSLWARKSRCRSSTFNCYLHPLSS